MNFKYLLASPKGDIPVVGEELDRSLYINPSEIHPALVLRDYFESIRDLLLDDNAKILTSVIAEGFGRNLTPDRIASVELRCEKVGTLYHVASLTVRWEGDPLKLCIATAVTDEAIRCLAEEVYHFGFLADTYHLHCLPKIFYKGEAVRHTPKGDATLSHSLQEWFENHHEWHLSLDDSGGQRIILWDMEKGYRLFSIEEGAEIHRQAAKILTLYYEFPTGRQIHPWSHAAGDFVVKVDDRSFSVKLISVRGYEPLPLFRDLVTSPFMVRQSHHERTTTQQESITEPLVLSVSKDEQRIAAQSLTEKGDVDPFIRIVYFFLDLTLRMRLDRLDGTGHVLWAESFILRPVAGGFFEALSSEEVRDRYPPGARERIRRILKSFTEDEIRTFLQSMRDLFSGEEKGVVEKHLRDHARDLVHTIQKSF
jgi:hypothetical protein